MPIYILGALVIIFLIVIIIRYRYIEYSKKRNQQKRFQRGNQLEQDAKDFLRKKGYKIVEEQYAYHHNFIVDGKNEKSKLILDYIVSKSGKTFIVEVKSGEKAISIQNKNTRRQILEYDFTLKNDGIFLLDMENEKMQLIEFTPINEHNSKTAIRIIIVLFALGIVIPYWPVKIAILAIGLILWIFPKSLNWIKI